MDDSWAQEWIEDYGAAWRAGDADTVSELFAKDAVYRSSPFRPPAVGREAIRAYWRESCSTQEDLELRFGPGGRCEELREYWHAQDGRIGPPEGWGS